MKKYKPYVCKECYYTTYPASREDAPAADAGCCAKCGSTDVKPIGNRDSWILAFAFIAMAIVCSGLAI